MHLRAGEEAAERLPRTLLAEADRAGVELHAELFTGERGGRQAAAIQA